MDFMPGISVMLGPNGCGKSNFVDAVRWVVGGQSARRLRASQPSDVIFNGTTSRKALGRASVELLFDNSESVLSGRYQSYAEISVRREVDREGDSNYYFNQTSCRRADVVDIFTGTGLGSSGYAVVEQGAVSQLAEYKPEELRALVEEAAGVSRYRIKRRETVNKIERTRMNMERVSDKQAMLTERIRVLKIQASRADHYALYTSQKKSIQAQQYALELRTLEGEQQDVQRERAALGAREEGERSLLTRLETESETLLRRYDEANEKLDKARLNFYQQQGAVSRVEEEIKTRKAQEKEHRDALVQLEEEGRTQAERRSMMERMLNETAAKIAETKPEHAKKRTQVSRLRADCDEREQAWKGGMDSLSEQREALYRAQTELARSQDKLEQTESEIKRLSRVLDRLAHEQREHESANTGDVSPDAGAHDYARLQEEGERHSRALKRAQADVEQAEESLQRAREEWQRLGDLYGKQLPMTGKPREHTGSSRVRGLNLDAAPLLAESLCVDGGWVRAFCVVVEHHLGSYCLEDLRPVHTHLDELARSDNSLGFVSASSRLPYREPESPPTEGVWLSALLDRKDPLSPVLSRLLHGVIAVEDTARALKLYPALQSGQSVVSRAGVWVGDGFVRISGTHYDRMGDLRTLQQECTQAQAAVDNAASALADKRTVLAQCRQVAEAHKEQLLRASREEGRRLERQRQREVRAKRLEVLDDERTIATGQHRELEKALPALRKTVAQHEKVMVGAKKKVRVLEQARDGADQLLREARSLLDQNTEELRVMDLEYNRLQNVLQSARENLQQLRMGEKEHAKRISVAQTRAQENARPIVQLESKLQSELESYRVLEQAVHRAQDEVSAVHSEQKTYRDSQAKQQRGLDRVRDEAQHLSMRISEQQVKIDRLRADISETGFDCAQLLSELDEGLSAARLAQRMKRVDKRIERLGPVNPIASRDYETALEEQKHLREQYQDVLNSLDNLEKGLRRIDEESRKQFSETVKALNKRVQPYFRRLFQGGKIALTAQSADPWSGGIHLFAQPPGKRNQTVHQLSGGEKTLVAIALIFAIFELNPAPFCLLDEVDASLDDVNIERFIGLLNDVSRRVQLLCVSHHPATMACADRLLGVTLNTSGTSQVLGVSLQEAEQMVERDRVGASSG